MRPDAIDTAIQANIDAREQQTSAHAMALHEAGAADERAKSQAFFADLAGEIRQPHVGDFYRDFIKVVLKRAQDRGIYEPVTK